MNAFFLNDNECCGCSACSQICPKRCIAIRENQSGFLVPDFDKRECIDCGLCKNVCPVINYKENDGRLPRHGYAYLNPSEQYRLESASSGAFEQICRAFIDEDSEYSIYGCTMDELLKVKHCAVHHIDGIKIFRKSKYLQSRIDDVYLAIQRDVISGRKVVFSGTPCQVMALKRFLRKGYSNLLTVDFVCHGVPNQRIFDRYLAWIERKYRSKVNKYNFRNKHVIGQKWTNLGIKVWFENGKIIELDANDDLYMIGFLKGLYMRKGCYSCKFASLYRVSDITMGDFWGVGEIYPDLDESKTNGTSLLLVNSIKGETVVNQICGNSLYVADINQIANHNGQLNHPQKENSRRDIFFSAYNKQKRFDKCIKKAMPEAFTFRMEKIYKMRFYVFLCKIKRKLLEIK